MSLVTGLAADPEAGSQEVTGPTDPLRVVVSHTLQPDSRSISFTIDLLSRLTADIKGLVLRYRPNPLNGSFCNTGITTLHALLQQSICVTADITVSEMSASHQLHSKVADLQNFLV